MVTKKQMLVLLLGASTVGASYAKLADELALDNAAIRKFKKSIADLKPLADEFQASILNDSFDGIASTIASVDLTAALQFLTNNIYNKREKLINYAKIIAEHANPDVRTAAEAIVQKAEEKLAPIDALKNNFETILKYANLAQYRDTIEHALTSALNDNDFKTSVKATIKQQTANLKKLLGNIEAIDPAALQKSLNSAQDLYEAYDNGDLSLKLILKDVTPGVNEIRQNVLPIVGAIAAEIAAIVMEVYNVLPPSLKGLDQSVLDALLQINEIGIALQKDFKGLNPQIDEILKPIKKQVLK